MSLTEFGTLSPGPSPKSFTRSNFGSAEKEVRGEWKEGTRRIRGEYNLCSKNNFAKNTHGSI